MSTKEDPIVGVFKNHFKALGAAALERKTDLGARVTELARVAVLTAEQCETVAAALRERGSILDDLARALRQAVAGK